MTKLFVEHIVYKSKFGGVQVYTCLEVLGADLFAVQVSTLMRVDDGPEGLKQHSYYQADMLSGFLNNPDIRWFPTIQEAISAHDEDFS